jgi:phosphoglycerol transferase
VTQEIDSERAPTSHPGSQAQRPILREVAPLAILAVAVAGTLWIYAVPGKFDLRLPIAYGQGDSLWYARAVKLILESTWFPWQTHRLGAPFGTGEFDLPESEGLHYLAIKVVGLFSNDWVVVTNSYILAGFFLAAAAAYFFLRSLRVEPSWSMLGGLLFSFLPYHFFRLVPLGHLFLASYWNVPFAAWLAIQCWPAKSSMPRSSGMSTNRWVGLSAAAVATGSGGIYYAFFGCFVIGVSGIAAILARRSLRAGFLAGGLILGIALVAAVQIWPSILYRLQHGANPEVPARAPIESELYGLKIMQLVLPQPNHRAPAVRQLTARYNQTSLLTNENQSSALGLIGSIGFLVLLAAAFARIIRGGGEATTLDKLALLVVALLLLGTVAGVGSAFAWTFSPLVRAYNRVSIFIGLFSIAGLLIVLSGLAERIGAWFGEPRPLALVLAIGVGLFGLWDQTAQFDQNSLSHGFLSDRQAIAQAEKLLPPGAAIYQLPYHAYPESPPTHQLADYDLVRGYLHSGSLRWSYGAMKGRDADAWFRALSARPIEEQLDMVGAKGFAAVYIDRRGFVDRAARLEEALRKRLGAPLISSADGHLVLYRLASSGGLARPRGTPSVLSQQLDVAPPTLPSAVEAVEGCSEPEPSGRWTGRR